MAFENTKVFRPQGGDKIVIASGGELDMQDGSITNDTGKTFSGTITITEANAGVDLVPGVDGRTIEVTDFRMVIDGAWATGTFLKVQDSDGTVIAALVPVSALGDQAVITPSYSTVTLSAGFLGDLTQSAGLSLATSGSMGTGSGLNIAVNYKVS